MQGEDEGVIMCGKHPAEGSTSWMMLIVPMTSIDSNVSANIIANWTLHVNYVFAFDHLNLALDLIYVITILDVPHGLTRVTFIIQK